MAILICVAEFLWSTLQGNANQQRLDFRSSNLQRFNSCMKSVRYLQWLEPLTIIPAGIKV